MTAHDPGPLATRPATPLRTPDPASPPLADPPTAGYVVAREDGFDFRCAEYADLYDRSDATLFQHPSWIHHVYAILAPQLGAVPVVLTVRAAPGGRLLAVLPFVRRSRYGVRVLELADLGVCDHAAPVLDREAARWLRGDRALRGALWRSLDGFDLLRIERIVGGPEPFAELLGTRTHRRHPYHTHTVTLPESVADWPGTTLDPAFVRHLERKRKRLRPKGGVALRAVHDPGEVDDLLERLRAFRRGRFLERGGVDLVQEHSHFEFYRQVARDGVAGRGPAVLSVLEVGGEPAAVSLDLADDDAHLFLVVGYDFERLRNYSLGLLIVDELARAAIARGVRRLDLTVGDEGYKADFSAAPAQLWSTRRAHTVRGLVAGLVIDLEAYARRTAKVILAKRAARRAAREAAPA